MLTFLEYFYYLLRYETIGTPEPILTYWGTVTQTVFEVLFSNDTFLTVLQSFMKRYSYLLFHYIILVCKVVFHDEQKITPLNTVIKGDLDNSVPILQVSSWSLGGCGCS